MRVEEIEAVVGNYALKEDFTIAAGTITNVPQVFVTVKVSGNGKTVTGFGHNSISHIWSDRREDLSLERKLEQEVQCIEHIADNMARSRFEFENPFGFYDEFCAGGCEGYEGLPALAFITAVSPFDLALWDAHGKMYGRNVFDLSIKNTLGSVSRNPEIMYTFGIGEDPDSVRQVIKEYGISSIKPKLTGEPEKDVGIVNAIGKVAGVKNIIADANESYESIEALKYLIKNVRVSLSGLFAIETPFSRDSNIDIKALETDIPVFADENLVTDRDVEKLDKLGYKGLALKPPTRTFSGFLRSLDRAKRKKMECVVMDLTTGPPIGYAVQVVSAYKMGGVLTEANGRQYYDWDMWVKHGFPGEEYRDAFYVKNGHVDPSVFFKGNGWGISKGVFHTYKDMALI